MQNYSIIGADGREYGPVSIDQLRQWIREGRANAETRVRVEGTTQWTTVGALSELSIASGAPATIAPVATQAAQGTPFRRTNSMAVTGLIMGILALTVGFCCCGLPFNVLGLIFSAMALNQIKNSPDLYEGRGIAIAGLVLSILSLLLIFGRVLLFGAISHFPHASGVYHL